MYIYQTTWCIATRVKLRITTFEYIFKIFYDEHTTTFFLQRKAEKESTIEFIQDSKKSKWEIFYLSRKITLYTMYLPEFKTIHYVILFTRRFEKINKIT